MPCSEIAYLIDDKIPCVFCYRVEGLVSRLLGVAQLHKTGIHESALFRHILRIQILPAQVGYQMEHLVLQVRNIQMAHTRRSHETNLSKGS